MSATLQPSRPQEPATAANRSIPILLAAAGLVVGVVAAVLLFGIARPPALASLSDRPDPAPSAGVAWSTWRDGGSCIEVAQPDGSVAEVRCEPQDGELVGWVDGGPLLLARYGGGAPRVLEIDPDTGEVLGTRPEEPEESFREGRFGDLAVASYRDRGDLVVVMDGTELWRVDAPDAYDIRGSAMSPDGRFVALTDTADRLLVLEADGSTPPRVWAEDVPSWNQLIWEGQTQG